MIDKLVLLTLYNQGYAIQQQFIDARGVTTWKDKNYFVWADKNIVLRLKPNS